MAKDLNDLINKLSRLENNLGEIVAPEVQKLFRDSVCLSLAAWYNSYSPHMYHRTYNFLSVLENTRASGKGNIITMTTHSGSMSTYPGFEIPPYKGYQRQSLQPSTAFDFFFMSGEHGHGKWMMQQSVPPYRYVDKDIHSGFGGRINSIIAKCIGKYMQG